MQNARDARPDLLVDLAIHLRPGDLAGVDLAEEERLVLVAVEGEQLQKNKQTNKQTK